MTLGEVLAQARKDRNKSLKEIAARVKKEDGSPISPQYLNDIEHGRRAPSDFVLGQLAKVYDFPPDYLHFLAGSIPTDLRERPASQETVVLAYKAFRRRLGQKK